MHDQGPLISNDAVVFGILMAILALVFATSSSKNSFFTTFYRYVPALLLCYFIPSLLNTSGLNSGESSALSQVASIYLLPASLVLFPISTDFKGILNLEHKALEMFLPG